MKHPKITAAWAVTCSMLLMGFSSCTPDDDLIIPGGDPPASGGNGDTDVLQFTRN